VQFDDWRPGDQRYYVSDTRKFHRATGWNPRYSVVAGVGKLYEWLKEAMPTANPLPAPEALVI
jgi:CDP-paratose 2-epimerase